jgi:hypothetical protein
LEFHFTEVALDYNVGLTIWRGSVQLLLSHGTACREEGKQYAFLVDRPNPHVLTGAMVGGPNIEDWFADKRLEFHFTEVALDYNVGLTTALAAMVAVPPDFWSVDCAAYVKNYPWK